MTLKDLEKFQDNESKHVSPMIKRKGSNSSKIVKDGIFLDIKNGLYADYGDYLKKITSKYATFKNNHGNKPVLSKQSSMSYKEPENHLKLNRMGSEISELSTSSNLYNKYDSLSESFLNLIGSNYFSNNFKIEEKYLNSNIHDIGMLTMQLMEKNSNCEKLMSTILSHSNILYSYIIDHSHFLNNINDSLDILSFSKVKLAKTKHRYIDNGVKMIYLKSKKEQLSKIKTKIHELKEIYEINKRLDESSINQAKMIIQKHSDSNKLKVINLFKEKIDTIEESLHEQSVNNIISEISNLLNKTIELSNKSALNNHLFSNINQIIGDKQDLINELTLKFPYILNEYNDSFCKNIIFDCLKDNKFSSGNKSNKLVKVKSSLLNIINLRLKEIKDTYDHNIYAFFNNKIDNFKIDQIFLIILSNKYVSISKFISDMKNEFLLYFKEQHLTEEDNKAIDEILLKSNQNINYIITNIIEANLAGFVNTLAVEQFITSVNLLLNTNSYFFKYMNIDVSAAASKPLTDFIFQFFEDKALKLQESIEYDDYSAVNVVAPLYQSLALMLSNKEELNRIKEINEKSKIIECFDKHSALVYSELSEFNTKGLIKVNNKMFKCCLSMFETIKFIYEVLKMSILFEDIYQEQIFLQFVKIMSHSISFSKENILDGKGYEKGTFKSINQNVLLIYASSLSFLNNVLKELLLFIKDKKSNQVINTMIEDLINKINGYIIQTRDRIYAMYSKK